MKKTLLIAVLASIFTTTTAQTPDTSTVLNDVIITENRLQIPFSETSRSIDIIQRRQIESMPVRTLPELLNYVAGVDVRQRGPMGVQPDITIRGGTFDQVLILINGVKFIDPQTGRHAYNIPIDLSQIERIEVLKGSGGRIYGQNALTGAINIVTRQVTEETIYGGLQVGDFGLISGRVGGTLPTKFGNHRISVSHSQADGYRPNSDFKLFNALYQNDLTIMDNKVRLLGGYTERRFGASGFYSTANFSNEREKVHSGFWSLEVPFAIHQVKATARASWRNNVDEYFFDYTNYATRNFTRTIVANGELHFSHDNKFGTSGLSVEGSQQQFRNARLGDHSRDVLSVFGEHRFHFFDKKLDITPGLMLAYYTDFGNQVMPGIDAGFRVNDRLKINANWGRTFRVPTYTDLYFFSASINNNPSLKPEKANSFELGAKYKHPRFSAQFAVFQRDAQNLIDRTRNETTAKWNTNNQNGLLLRGLEIGTNVRLDAAGKYRLDASYFRVLNYDFKKVELLSRYALDFLTDQFNIGIDAQLPYGFNANVRSRTNKRLSQAVDYTVLDAKLGWQKGAYSVFMQASNLFNKAYAEQNNIPMPSRWFVLGVDFLFK